MKKNQRKILFLINGLGLGNSTRCYAIIKELCKRGHEVSLFTNGNGLWFFSKENDKEIKYIGTLNSYNYASSKSGINIVKTLFYIPIFIFNYLSNLKKISRHLSENKYDLIISDSIYQFIPPLRYSTPSIAINNSKLVKEYKESHISHFPTSLLLQYYFIEILDYYYHCIFPKYVICPSIKSNSLFPTRKSFYFSPPIVRPITRDESLESHPEKIDILIMLSGSNISAPFEIKNRKDHNITIIGNAPTSLPRDQKIHIIEKTTDTMNYISKSKVVIINGGFSAISEALYLGIPMVVIPILKHAEQWVNAKFIEDLGLGLVGTNSNAEKKATTILSNLQNYTDKLADYKGRNGVEVSTNMIESFMS